MPQQLLEVDPDLGNGLAPAEMRAARRALPVASRRLEVGPWQDVPRVGSAFGPSSRGTSGGGGSSGPGEPPDPAHLGYLVASGLVVRRVMVGAGSSVELLGRGDLLRPWQEDAASFCSASWEVLEPTVIVILEPRLAQALGQWPVVFSNLLSRGLRRSRMLAADAAIASIVGLEERLLILLWQLAETWGRRTPDGARIEIRLPHRLLAELLGARRPSVTTALTRLQEAGRVSGGADGCWLLPGEPP